MEQQDICYLNLIVLLLTLRIYFTQFMSPAFLLPYIIPFSLELYERLTKLSILILKSWHVIFASLQLTCLGTNKDNTFTSNYS